MEGYAARRFKALNPLSIHVTFTATVNRPVTFKSNRYVRFQYSNRILKLNSLTGPLHFTFSTYKTVPTSSQQHSVGRLVSDS